MWKGEVPYQELGGGVAEGQLDFKSMSIVVEIKRKIPCKCSNQGLEM